MNKKNELQKEFIINKLILLAILSLMVSIIVMLFINPLISAIMALSIVAILILFIIFGSICVYISDQIEDYKARSILEPEQYTHWRDIKYLKEHSNAGIYNLEYNRYIKKIKLYDK